MLITCNVLDVMECLAKLRPGEWLTQANIWQRTGVSPKTLTALGARLVEKRWVQVRTEPGRKPSTAPSGPQWRQYCATDEGRAWVDGLTQEEKTRARTMYRKFGSS